MCELKIGDKVRVLDNVSHFEEPLIGMVGVVVCVGNDYNSQSVGVDFNKCVDSLTWELDGKETLGTPTGRYFGVEALILHNALEVELL